MTQKDTRAISNQYIIQIYWILRKINQMTGTCNQIKQGEEWERERAIKE